MLGFQLMKKCHHGRLTKGEERDKEWIDPNSEAFEKNPF